MDGFKLVEEFYSFCFLIHTISHFKPSLFNTFSFFVFYKWSVFWWLVSSWQVTTVEHWNSFKIMKHNMHTHVNIYTSVHQLHQIMSHLNLHNKRVTQMMSLNLKQPVFKVSNSGKRHSEFCRACTHFVGLNLVLSSRHQKDKKTRWWSYWHTELKRKLTSDDFITNILNIWSFIKTTSIKCQIKHPDYKDTCEEQNKIKHQYLYPYN